MSRVPTLLRSAAWRFGTEGVASLSSVIQVAVIGRALGLERTGEVLIAITATQLLKRMCALGTPTAVVWQLPRRRADVRRATAVGPIIGAGVLLALGLFYVPLTLLLSQEPMVALWPVIVVATAAQVAGDHLVGSLRTLEGLARANLVRLVQSLTSLVGVGLAGLLSTRSDVMLFGWSSGWLLYAGLGAFSLMARGQLGLWPTRRIFLEQTRYGLRVFPGLVFAQGTYRADLLLVGWLLGSGAAGVYGVALRLVEVLNLVPNAVSFVSFPAASRAATGRERSQIWGVLRGTVAASTVLGITLGAAAPLIVPVLVGEGFSDALIPLWVLLPGAIMLSGARVLFPELLARDHTRSFVVLSACGFGGLIVLDLALIPIFGVLGAAVASSTTYIGLAMTTFIVCRRLGVSDTTKELPKA